ncbi:uncharacterized protein LOC134182645 [Corticium candelabrum]|uniref:uncharacterized protein LOC134182645 n=1 Tax=Corticium candelabrum TaxID=121492 RepID=UPI002E2537BC|nr:uncharacterized protein LOC134182645 [Corticium candelabrum]
MSQPGAITSIYASEFEVIRESFGKDRLRKGPQVLGHLYGLWTHSGNVLIQLANAASGSLAAEWESLSAQHRLETVGSWGTKEPKQEDRPYGLDESLAFVYVHLSPDNDKLICYSISKNDSVQWTELKALPAASPFRALKDRTTAKLLKSGMEHSQENSSLDLKEHWSSKKTYKDFLKDFRECFSRAGMEVKQFQHPGSEYIAFQVQSKDVQFAVGFPSDFNRKQKVDIYRDKQDPFEVPLALKAQEDFAQLLHCVSDRANDQPSGKGPRK